MDPYMAMLLAQGVPAGLAARFARRHAPAPPPEPESLTDKYARGYDDAGVENLGYTDAGFGGFLSNNENRDPLPIVEQVTKVPGIHDVTGRSEIQGPTRRLPQATGEGQALGSTGGLFEGSDELGELGRIGGNLWNAGRRGARDLGIYGNSSDEIPEWRGGAEGGAGTGGIAAAASTPGPNAPMAPGQRPTDWIDPNGSDWQSKIAAIDRAVKARVLGQHGAQASGSTVASRYSTNADRAPEFADMTQTAPERLTPTLQRDNPVTGRHWSLLPHEGIDPETKQKIQYGGGFVQDAGPDTPEQHKSALAGLAARAFHPQTYDPATMDVSEATHQKDLEGQQQDLAMRHMEAQIAREEAQARDPYGMGRFALEQAALNQRAQGRDQAGIERAMAADRTGLLERQDKQQRASQALDQYQQRLATIDAMEAQIPPDAPPDDPRRAHVAAARERASQDLRAEGAILGVRFPEQ